MADIALRAQAGLVSHRRFVVWFYAEADFERRAGSWGHAKLKQVCGSDRAGADHSLRQQGLIYGEGAGKTQRSRGCGCEHDVDRIARKAAQGFSYFGY